MVTIFSKETDLQENLLDGTVYCYEPVPGEGVYVTIAGRDDQVYIVAFDMADLGYLKRAAEYAQSVENRESSSEDLARVTPTGMARQGSARLGMAGMARRGQARRGEERRGRHGLAWQAWRVSAWLGTARHGTAGEAGRGSAMRGSVGCGGHGAQRI